ncbi:MAG: GNAT family N-acetyltransferase [Crocinitomicaceae bacterium]
MRKLITETPRLYIRNWLQEDIAPYAEIIGDPDVMRFIGDGKPKPPEEAIRAVEKYNGQIEAQGWTRFAVALKDTDHIIGFCGFDVYQEQLDFGWRLAKDQWGKGYATEAARAVLELGIHQFSFDKIVCHAFTENIGSINVIEKLGMPFEKEWMFHEKPVRQYAWVRPS